MIIMCQAAGVKVSHTRYVDLIVGRYSYKDLLDYGVGLGNIAINSHYAILGYAISISQIHISIVSPNIARLIA